MSTLSKDFASQFVQSAKLFPHMLDIPSDQILVSHLSEEDYREASFLDQRIITPQLSRYTIRWNNLEDLQMRDSAPPNYIFHIGHVGSTLISRLLGEHANVLALREPQILRDLTEISQTRHQPQSPWSPDQYASRLDLVTSWLSRSFHDQQSVMIKASSFSSEISHELINDENKALFLYVSLSKYLETILAGEGSRGEANQLAGARLLRINKRLDTQLGNLWQLNHVQQVALGWLCEMITLTQVYDQKGIDNIYWHNFDTFLKNPALELGEIAKHFGLKMEAAGAQKLVSGPIMNSYSKAPEHNYSADLRRQLLQQARTNFGYEINKTIDWVKSLAKDQLLIETIINFACKD